MQIWRHHQKHFMIFLAMNSHDGVIASRYMPGAKISPARPLITRWGCELVYEPMVFILFGLSYKDFQCGSKSYLNDLLLKQLLH